MKLAENSSESDVNIKSINFQSDVEADCVPLLWIKDTFSRNGFHSIPDSDQEELFLRPQPCDCICKEITTGCPKKNVLLKF